MKIVTIALLFLALASPSLGQTADVFIKNAVNVFVKGENPQDCWADVKEIAHRHAADVFVDDKHKVLKTSDYQTIYSRGWGDAGVAMQILSSKDEKGATGCRIYIAAQGQIRSSGENLSPPNTLGNNSQGISYSNMIASLTATEVQAIKKAREKKAKKP